MVIQLAKISETQNWIKNYAPHINPVNFDVVYTWPVYNNQYKYYYTLNSIGREIGRAAMESFCRDMDIITTNTDLVAATDS